MTSYLTTQEAAKILRLKPSTIQKYVRDGVLKANKVGRQYLIDRVELERFMAR